MMAGTLVIRVKVGDIAMSSLPPPLPLPAQLEPERGAVAANAPRRSSRNDAEILLLACAVVLLSFALRVEGDRVAFWFLPQWPLPQVCGAGPGWEFLARLAD